MLGGCRIRRLLLLWFGFVDPGGCGQLEDLRGGVDGSESFGIGAAGLGEGGRALRGDGWRVAVVHVGGCVQADAAVVVVVVVLMWVIGVKSRS